MNRYPRWVNWLVLVIMLLGTLIALPNVFPDDPAVQVSRPDGVPVTAPVLTELEAPLREAGIGFISSSIEENTALIRFVDFDVQVRANELLGEAFPAYTAAQTLAPRTPAWLRALGLWPVTFVLHLGRG